VDITVDYPQKAGVLRGVRIDIRPGEILGLVGESGSGKSTLALAILGLLSYSGASTRGRTVLLGRDLATASEREMRTVRGRLISLIPQNPASALNPVLRIGTQLHEAWRAHSTKKWVDQIETVKSLLVSVGLPGTDDFFERYPGQISIGQAQRVLIAMALLHNPALLIADEPTSALDIITQREVLELLAKVGRERNMSLLFISHDLLAVASLCHRIAILNEGHIVECGSVEEILRSPAHPYTRRLIAAVENIRTPTVKLIPPDR